MGLRESSENSHSAILEWWLIPALLIVVTTVINLFGEPGRELLRYDRVWIGQGETWRLLSGHFAHLGWSHLMLNIAGLVLIWVLVGRRFHTVQWLIVMVITLITMSLGFWILNPELYWYVGMSGMLHGVLAAGVIVVLPKMNTETLLLAVLLVGKIAWEQIAGPMPGSVTTSGGAVVVDAHLYGAIGGVLGALLLKIRRQQD